MNRSLPASFMLLTILVGILSLYDNLTPNRTALALDISTDAAHANNFQSYVNPTVGIKIQYPVEWGRAVHFFGNFALIQFTPRIGVNQSRILPTVELYTENLSNTTTSGEYSSLDNRLLNSVFGSYQIVESNSTKIDDQEGWKKIFDIHPRPLVGNKNEPGDIRVMKTFVVNNSTGYIFTYFAQKSDYENYLPIANYMLNSLAIIPIFEREAMIHPSNDIKVQRQLYLHAWNSTTFHSGFDTLIKTGSYGGYGVYDRYLSPIFDNKDKVYLYVEPLGYSYKELFDPSGSTLYLTNFTADILIYNKSGDQLSATHYDILPKTVSHNKNTEQAILLNLPPELPLNGTEFNIKFRITDANSGKSFEILKNIRIGKITKSQVISGPHQGIDPYLVTNH